MSLITQVVDALKADATIADDETGVGGRVYDVPLKLAGNRSTPEAYDDGIVLPSLVVRDEGTVADFGRPDARNAYVVVWMHGPDTIDARAILDGLIPVIVATLKATTLVGYNGTGTDVTWADEFGLQENPTEPDEVVNYLRFAISKMEA